MIAQDVVAGALADFKELRLSDPEIDRKTDEITIWAEGDVGDRFKLVTITRHAWHKAEDPSRVLVEVARAVAPKELR